MTRLFPLFSPRLLVALAIPVVLVGHVPGATAAPLSWRMAASGNAGIAANWIPTQVPAPADVLTFHVGGTYTVTFDGTVPLVTSHVYRSGDVTVITTGHSTSSTIRVGDVSGDVGTLTLTSGTLNANDDILVGNEAGTAGTLRVENDEAEIRLPGATSDVYVGHGGTGTLEITGGGGVLAADDVILGNQAGSQGTVLVSGVNTFPTPVFSLLESAGTDGDILVGNSGTGSLTVAAAGRVYAAEMFVAYLPGSHGFVEVGGAHSGIFSLVRLGIGGSMTTPGGTALVSIDSGATVSVGDGPAPIRVHEGSTLRVATGGALYADGNVNVSGRMELAGGLVNLGSLDHPGSLNFQPGGELEGFGTVAGYVTAGADNEIRSGGGELHLGSDSIGGFGFGSSGTLICTAGAPVMISDIDGSNLGNVVLEGGQLTIPPPGTVQAGKTMSGTGLVLGSGPLRIAGTLSPGTSAGTAGNSAGMISLLCPFSLLAGGKLAMQVGDAATGQHDRLNTNTRSVTLAGTLDIRLLAGFYPEPNELFTLITCGSRTGTFSEVTFFGQPVNGQFTILYNETSVQLRVNDVTTAVPLPGELPRELAFAAAGTGFELALPEAVRVVVRLYDAAGRAVATLHDGEAGPGVIPLPMVATGRNLGDGVYFGRAMVRRQGFERVLTAKAVLVR